MISFGLTEDLSLLQEMVRKFAVEEIRPKLRDFEKARALPDELRRRFHGLGVSLIDAPEAAGGMGLGTLAASLVHEELAFGDPGVAVALWAPHFLPAAVLELGDEEQAQRLLARFDADDGALRRGAVAWGEAGRGLPAEGFAATARPDGQGAWLIDGDKAFVVNAGLADLYIVFAQVDAGAGWRGVGAFAVEGSDPGVSAGERSAWIGLETVTAGTVAFKGCRGERLRHSADGVGEAGMRRFFARSSLVTAARQVGLARAAYEFALAYTQDRTAFGKPVAHFQAISFNLAEMHMDVESARWLVWRAAWAYDRRLTPSSGPTTNEHAVAVAKAAVHANDAAWRVADDAVQLLGGAGYIQDFPVEKWLRDTKAMALIGGCDQLAQLTIAGHALGKPEEFGDGLPAPWIQPVVT